VQYQRVAKALMQRCKTPCTGVAPTLARIRLDLWHRNLRSNSNCRCRSRGLFFLSARQPPVGHGLLIHKVSRSHTTTHHSRLDSSGRVISSLQRPLPENTQHSQQTDINAPVGFEPTISAGERWQTYALDRAATGTGGRYSIIKISYNQI